ncbi:jg27104, partial [Pararge aegeria aegeria]
MRNQNPDRDSTAEDYAQGSVDPLPWRLVTNVTSLHGVSTTETIQPGIEKVIVNIYENTEVSESDSAKLDNNIADPMSSISCQNLGINTEKASST